MIRYVVVRVWLADRPGSLGRVATKIGEVELTDGCSPEGLADALSELSGVEVEDLRQLVSRVPYAGRDPLDAAVRIAESNEPDELLAALAQGVCAAFACDWSAVLDMGSDGPAALTEVGHPPCVAWLGAFVAGARVGRSLSSSDGVGLVGPRDVAWAPLDSSELVVVSGRGGPPFRSRERRQLQQLCRVADARWYEVARTGARGAHPSGAKQFANQRLAVS